MHIFDIFEKANKTLKYPQLTYPHDKTMLVFKLAGEKSSVPGSIVITDDARYPHNKFYGRIIKNEAERKLQFQWNDRQPIFPELREVIKAIVTNPLGMCSLIGKQHSYCCFCSTELTSKESLAVGYGPICAEKWGLPWGITETIKKEDL